MARTALGPSLRAEGTVGVLGWLWSRSEGLGLAVTAMHGLASALAPKGQPGWALTPGCWPPPRPLCRPQLPLPDALCSPHVPQYGTRPQFPVRLGRGLHTG